MSFGSVDVRRPITFTIGGTNEFDMRTDDESKGLRLSHCALPAMKARLALLNAALSALQHYQGQSEEDLGDEVASVPCGFPPRAFA